jgi:hypothetical protein
LFSIGITTFERRFEKYFKPLIEGIKRIEPDIGVIVTVNGEYGKSFSELYRQNMLSFLSDKKNVYPVFFPEFRGLAKLWNTILIHSTSDFVLILNDDVSIVNPSFVNDIVTALAQNQGRSFYINWSWSHFVVCKKEIDELGYFDERLLGIGEEDGDMTWRYLRVHDVRIPNFDIHGFVNYSKDTMSEKPENVQCHSGTKYSQFNRDFIYTVKYKRDDDKGLAGMFDFPVSLHLPCHQQYPYERFFQEYKKELQEGAASDIPV